MGKINTLFIIDDDEDDVELFEEAVHEILPTARCLSAFSCADGIQKLNDVEEVLPDIIFLDLNMPGKSGKECLVEIKKIARAHKIPVVIYTTSSHERDVQETRELGAAHFITKPSSFSGTVDELLKVISNGAGRTIS